MWATCSPTIPPMVSPAAVLGDIDELTDDVINWVAP